jgi:hypothetical protein
MSFKKIFKLDDIFTKEELKNAYINKIKEIDIFDIPKIDKKLYKENIYELYLDGYKNINNINKKYKNNRSSSYSYNEALSQYINPDGSITYIKDINENKNGKIKNYHIGYKKYIDGTITSID